MRIQLTFTSFCSRLSPAKRFDAFYFIILIPLTQISKFRLKLTLNPPTKLKESRRGWRKKKEFLHSNNDLSSLANRCKCHRLSYAISFKLHTVESLQWLAHFPPRHKILITKITNGKIILEVKRGCSSQMNLVTYM
jgi:hypothetical protein